MKKIFGLTFLIVMLVGLVGCKPLTGSTVCPHDWVDTDDTKVTSAKYYEVSEGVYNLEKVEVSPKYKCSICGEEHEKTISFFTTDDHKTTIGVAIDVTLTIKKHLPIDTTWTVEKYNSYYTKAVVNYGITGWKYYCKCSCEDGDGCECGTTCKDDCDKTECVRSSENKVYFSDYYIEY